MKYFPLFLLLTFYIHSATAQPRYETKLEQGWKFSRSDDPEVIHSNYDDNGWQKVTVPHDWAIYGPFSIHNDMQMTSITQDGQKQAMEHAGRTGGLPFMGVGWYRLTFTPEHWQGSGSATLKFDGAMSHARVYLNGREVGYWPYGYNTFHFDVSDHLKKGENTLAVRLENMPESSRWYPGAGLYRNVHLIITPKVHIPVWGTYITTPVINDEFALVNVATRVEFDPVDSKTYQLRTEIYDMQNRKVADVSSEVYPRTGNTFHQQLNVSQPTLWDVDNPNLYRAVSTLLNENEPVDRYVTPFGIRSIEIRANDGFYLNGKKTLFKGVCMHHDLGPLGAAVNDAAIRRQVRILKEMGANAIRTSHNMPAPELVKACDEMGMMLMVESFDEWRIPKMKNGYNLHFDAWAEKDLVNLIHNYRNNPSVVMWCIGNEVPEQGAESGAQTARFLQDICHRKDPTRPVTQGMDNPDAVINNNFAAVMDVAGFNYRPFKYPEAYRKLPQQLVLGSETVSTVSSRGVYKFPLERRSMMRYPDHQASSYDVEHCGWSDLPEDNFIMHDDFPYCIGEFVWTGFDYLGEPTPYYTDWPSHSSLFGIVDLAGIPKDRYYLYKSHWKPEEPTLHILPHWTWPGREGQVTPVHVYTNYPVAELFINGKSQGVVKKDTTIRFEETENNASKAGFERQRRYRLMWNDVVYEPGTVRVTAFDENGKIAAVSETETAGKPYRIELEADRNRLAADEKDLSFIRVRVVDRRGNLCPHDSTLISFRVTGAGSFHAVANGNPASLESFQQPQMKVFSGQLTAIVRAGGEKGAVIFRATGKGLKSATLKLNVE